MARLPRIAPAGVAQHVIQRGNNRQVCFANEEDYIAYVGWLKAYSKKCDVEIHAWVLMTNHVHLLCTPRAPNAVANMMQSIGRCYVRYFNQSYQRTGTLWQGRYKACLVQEEDYLLQVYRYIELNPVRAGMVNAPEDYFWSSYQINAQGKYSELCTPHSLYLALGSNECERRQHYQALVAEGLNPQQIDRIRTSLNKTLPLGGDNFATQISSLTNMRLPTGKPGRPVGWRKKKEGEEKD